MNYKKLLAGVMTASMILSTGTAPSFAKAKKKAPVKITLNKKAMTIKKGKTFRLKLNGTKTIAKASVSNKKIVKLTPVKKKKKVVKNQWIVKGLKAGKTKVTVKAGKRKYVCKVTVIDKKTKKKTSVKKPTQSSSKTNDSTKQKSTTPNSHTAQANNTQTQEQSTASKPSDETAQKQAQNTVPTSSDETTQSANTQTQEQNTVSKPSEETAQKQTQNTVATPSHETTQSANTQTQVENTASTSSDETAQTSSSQPTDTKSEQTPQTPTKTDNTRIFFSDETLDAMAGDTSGIYGVTINVLSNTYSKSDVVFKSSNPEIATVDQTGKVTPKKQGSADIIASVGPHSATETIKVHDVTMTKPELPYKVNLYYTYNYNKIASTIEITDITEKDKSYGFNGYINETIDIKGKVTYVDKDVISFPNDDLSVGVFDENNKDASETFWKGDHSIFYKPEGSTFEFSTTRQLGQDKTYNLKFLPSSEYYYLTNKSDVDNTVLSKDYDGEFDAYTDCTVNIGMYYHFASTYYKRSDLTYSSSDESIATIDSYGNMTGKSVGKVDITVSVGSHKLVLHYFVHGWNAETPQTPFKVNMTGYKNPEPPATATTSVDNSLTVTHISFKHSYVSDKVIYKTMYIEGILDHETSKSDYYVIPLKIYDDSNHLLTGYSERVNPISDDGKTFKGSIGFGFTRDKNYRIEFGDSSAQTS
ncbi:hypothetical protein SG0102_26120 [Intestinibaculum porci]|uniref:BIG2 domain-containing protein n=1 Tax=Intestinibaculum porci TaxID=2487118 RepID=A0A3G9JT44_9FIRM|nr:Ig-like domain-containing protein [Intestinibaculum porci]BBH27678.1 hypothetical protein SG0102_26120 [Intestinibaculum porci]